MEHSKTDPDNVGHSMLGVLDLTLSSHLERITGTREGIHGLPMDLVTVACIVLMAERVENPGDPREKDRRYRQSEFQEELAEMGFEDDQRLQETLDSMVNKGYVEIDPRGGITPGKPAISMARLLDHAFPGMPGMNLVAYFVQTLDEVESGRKGAKDAVMQLDQMLRRHGAASFARPSKGTRPESAVSAGKAAAPAPGIPSRLKKPPRLRIPAEIRFPASEGPVPLEESPSDTPVPEEVKIEITSEAHETPGPSEETGGTEHEAGFETSMADLSHEEKTEDTPRPLHETTEPEYGESPFERSFELEGEAALEEPEEQQQDIEPDIETHPSPSDLSGPSPQGPEVLVDERVAAFEEELAMQCPVCRKSSIESRETAKGRTYYKCTDEQCMFISWGRPHHVACPLCGNSFLVESSSGEGSINLKCPRATCRYREDPSKNEAGSGSKGNDSRPPPPGAGKPRRRVVRRRVLRRKR